MTSIEMFYRNQNTPDFWKKTSRKVLASGHYCLVPSSGVHSLPVFVLVVPFSSPELDHNLPSQKCCCNVKFRSNLLISSMVSNTCFWRKSLSQRSIQPAILKLLEASLFSLSIHKSRNSSLVFSFLMSDTETLLISSCNFYITGILSDAKNKYKCSALYHYCLFFSFYIQVN